MIKRLFDIFGSLVGLLFIIPVFLIIAILIKIKMPGPIFFLQERIGRNGKPFIIYKFRSMVVNHEGNSVSIKGESRITSLGAKLRKYKLDELPELFNILKGDMSFVGPRPDVAEYTNRLVGEETKILNLRPGLTGPASIKYVNEEELLASVPDPQRYFDEVLWPDKVRINLSYYYNSSFLKDLQIIIKTLFPKVKC